MSSIPPPDGVTAPAVLAAAILEHAGFAIITTDTSGLITAFNRMAEQLLGYAAADVVGKASPGMFHLEAEVVARAGEFSRQLGIDMAPGFDVFVAKTRLNLPNEHEWTYVRRDGSGFPVLLSVTALRDGAGTVIGFLGMAVDLSARKRAEQAARNSEQRYQQVFDENPTPMLVYDVTNLEIVAANDALLTLYGYRHDVLLGQPLSMLYPPSEHEALRQQVDHISRRDNAPLRRRWKNCKRDGAPLLVDVVSRWQSFDERMTRLVVFNDVTDRVAAETQLQDQQHFMQSLLEALPTPIFYKDSAGRYLGANQAFYDLLGVTPAQYVGKTVEELSPPALAARYRAADEALFGQPDQTQSYEAQVRSGSGEMRDVVFVKAVFRDHQNQVAGLIGAILDMTERHRAEQAVQESEARLAQILHNSPLPVFVIDEEHRIVIWNPACERIFGMPADQLLGSRDAWRAFYPSARPVMADIILDGGQENEVANYYQDAYRRSSFNPDAFEAEGFFPQMDEGRGRWLYFTASPLRDGTGKVVGAIETLVDISERKTAEAQTRQLTAELEQRVVLRTRELATANDDLKRAMGQLVQTEKLASLGNLVAGVAHELNTPLGNMLTVATTLHQCVLEFDASVASGGLRRSVLADFVNRSLEATRLLERSAERASELISHFKQVAVDQTSVRRRKFDLAKVVEETLFTLRPTLGKMTHQLVTDIAPGIVMDSYPGPLEQVLINFVTNSLVHGFEGRSHGTMHIQAYQAGDRLILVYRDDGAGMAAAAVSHAFDPFFTTRLGKGGSGLGLYIVYNMVTAVLGGRIELRSQPQAGVEFVISLPLVVSTRPVSGVIE